MRLIHDLINRRLDQMKDLGLNNQDYKSIWHFYQVYRICLNVGGIEDKKINGKIKLLVYLLNNPNNIQILNKLKSYVSEDSFVVESVLSSLKQSEEVGEKLDDFYPVDIFGVNLDDRGL